MLTLLTQFIDTLDAALRSAQGEAGAHTGLAQLTVSQLRYLDAIATLGEPTVSDVAQHLKVTKASATPAVNKLAALGYVAKTQSTEDKRVWRITLTPATRPLIAAKQRALAEYETFIRSALTEQEVGQLEHVLAKLVRLFAAARNG